MAIVQLHPFGRAGGTEECSPKMFLVPPAGFAVARCIDSNAVPTPGPCIPSCRGSGPNATVFIIFFLSGRIIERRIRVRPSDVLMNTVVVTAITMKYKEITALLAPPYPTLYPQ